jgi:hypothetical protein
LGKVSDVGSQSFVQLAIVDAIMTVVVVTAWKGIESRVGKGSEKV